MKILLFQIIFVEKDSPSINQCIFQLRQGLSKVELYRLVKKFPVMLHLFQPSTSEKLSRSKLLQLLKLVFSKKGSNILKFEKERYAAFVRYCINPSIQFTEVVKEVCFKFFYS